MSDSRNLYSVRMRAFDLNDSPHESTERHLSGGERLVESASVEATVAELTARGLRAGAGPDSVRISVDRVPTGSVVTIPALPVTTVDAATPEEASIVALAILSAAGVGHGVPQAAFQLMKSGPVIPGAAVMDVADGRRLDPGRRGIRITRLDYTAEARESVTDALSTGSMPHPRTADALAIATKAIWADIVGEVCWSDDPDYVAGYVATAGAGYVRFPRFKPTGAAGGRVLFAEWTGDDNDLAIEILRTIPVLIDLPITINPPVSPASFLDRLRTT